MVSGQLHGADNTAIVADRERSALGPLRHRCATVGVVVTALMAVLSGCAEDQPQAPAAAAVKACEYAAVQQFNLASAGDVGDPRALTVQDGESFEVTGSAQGVDWVCTWLRTQSAEGVTVKTSIVER